MRSALVSIKIEPKISNNFALLYMAYGQDASMHGFKTKFSVLLAQLRCAFWSVRLQEAKNGHFPTPLTSMLLHTFLTAGGLSRPSPFVVTKGGFIRSRWALRFLNLLQPTCFTSYKK